MKWDFRKISDEVLKRSKGDHTVVKIMRLSDSNTRFAESRITQNMAKDELKLVVEVHKGKKVGQYSTTLNENVDFDSIAQRALEVAENSVEDPEYMPPVEKQDIEEHNLYFKETVEYSPVKKAEVLRDIFSDAEKSKVKVAGLFTTGYWEYYIANSLGLEAYHKRSFADLSITTMGEDSTGYATATDEDISKINAETVYREALDKCLKGKNPKDIEPGVYRVILEPEAFLGILRFLFFDLNARFADAGISYFSGKLGEKVFSDKVTMLRDPKDQRSPSLPFDTGSGFKLKKVYWIRNGVLENLEYDRYWAKKKGTEPTGRPYPVVFEDSDKSIQDLIKEVDRGILITRFWYIRHVDRKSLTLTGMTRDGTFYIENGEIKYPVKNMRFNESLATVLKGILDVGRGKKVPGYMGLSLYVPSVLVDGFNFASKSEAK